MNNIKLIAGARPNFMEITPIIHANKQLRIKERIF